MNIRKVLLPVTTAIFAMLLATGSLADSPDSAKEFRVGLISAQTGNLAGLGLPEYKAFKYYVEKAQAEGGINGRQLVFYAEDGQTDPTEAAKAARKLILKHKVQVIIGPSTGTAALAIGPIAARNKVPVIAYVSTIRVTDKDSGFYPWMYRAAPNGIREVTDIYKYIKENGYTRISLVFQRDAYGEAGAKKFESIVKNDKSGKTELVSKTSIPLNATDASVQASKATQNEPDVIVGIISSTSVGGALMRGLHKIGSKAQVLLGDGMATQEFLDVAGGAAEGAISFDTIAWDQPNKAQADFIKGFGIPSSVGAAVGGTAFLVLRAALEKMPAGPISGDALRDTLEHLCPFPTLIGSDGCYSPDDHDGDLHGITAQVVDGKWVAIDK